MCCTRTFVVFIAIYCFLPAASAQRYTPAALCAITNNTSYESLTLPLGIAAEYPSGSVQSISVTVGDTEQAGAPTAGNGDTEFVVLLLDIDNDGTPESLANASCTFDTAAVPPGCVVTQNLVIPTVTEDTTFRGRVMLSYGSADPANGCGANSYGDSEDILLVADVQELITLSDVSAPEDGGPITVSATLSHDVSDASGFVSFTVDYFTGDGTATLADNDYTAASGSLTFNGQAGDVQTFTITPTADIVPEGDQTIIVGLQNLSNSTHGIDISDTATITLLEDDTEVALTIAKSVDDPSPNIGSTILFTLQVNNAGPDDAVAAFVQDILPAGFTSVTPVSAPGSSSLTVSGNTIDWTGIDVPAGSSVSATFSAVVLAP